MEKLFKFKELIINSIKNDPYMIDTKIENVELCNGIYEDIDYEYLSIILRVINKKFSWEKLPYPDPQNIQFVLDKFNNYKFPNYVLTNCEVLYKLNYDEIDGLWVIKYENKISDNNSLSSDEQLEFDVNENIDEDENNNIDIKQDIPLEEPILENKNNKIDTEKKYKKKHKKHKLDYSYKNRILA